MSTNKSFRGPHRAARYKHQLIAADILNRIHSGEWKKGVKVPSLNELERAYPYSRMTILKALQDLTRHGYLRTERGVGTFVARDRLSGCVGLIISDDVLHPQTTPWPALLLRGLRSFFSRHNYVLKVYIETPGETIGEMPMEGFAEDLRRGLLSGVILANCNASKYLGLSKTWEQFRVPLFDITSWKEAPHRLMFDSEEKVRLAMQFCREKSRRRLAVIGSYDFAELESRARQFGIETRPAWTQNLSGPSDLEKRGYEAMTALWKQADKPDAILIWDDVVAKGALQAALRLGIVVPRDLLVLTHANRDSGIFYPFEVVRIEFDIGECANLAGHALLDLIDNPALPPRTIILRPRLNAEAAFDG